jgi:hypothetical protein
MSLQYGFYDNHIQHERNKYYQTLNSMIEDSNLRIIMEHYSYNIWALISLILLIIIVKNTNSIYLYNFLLIILFASIFATYKILQNSK